MIQYQGRATLGFCLHGSSCSMQMGTETLTSHALARLLKSWFCWFFLCFFSHSVMHCLTQIFQVRIPFLSVFFQVLRAATAGGGCVPNACAPSSQRSDQWKETPPTPPPLPMDREIHVIMRGNYHDAPSSHEEERRGVGLQLGATSLLFQVTAKMWLKFALA